MKEEEDLVNPGDQQRFLPINHLSQATLALVAHQIPVEMHEHFAVQVVMSLQHPFRSTLDGQYQPNVYGFVVDSNIAHACQPGDASVLIISIDAATDIGKAVRERLYGRSYALLEDLMDAETIHDLQSTYWSAMRATPFRFDPLALLTSLSLNISTVHATDDRVVSAMDYIINHLNGPLCLSDIATAVTLSEGRLRHLFVKETGIPITTYILWSRVKVALRGLVRQHMSLTQVAHLAGYADHAHFTRTFKRMFGVNPSRILEHSQFMYVFDEA